MGIRLRIITASCREGSYLPWLMCVNVRHPARNKMLRETSLVLAIAAALMLPSATFGEGGGHNQTVNSLWLAHSDDQTRNRQLNAVIAGLDGIGPKDELEGMIAGQLIAAHNAAMECYRRAMIPEQSFEARRLFRFCLRGSRVD
jgi:hypothetical protein